MKLQKEWLDLSESRVQQLLRALPEPTSPVAPSTPPLPTPPCSSPGPVEVLVTAPPWWT